MDNRLNTDLKTIFTSMCACLKLKVAFMTGDSILIGIHCPTLDKVSIWEGDITGE